MLTEIDDFTIHQTPGTMDQVQGRNPRWLDKLWFHIGTTDGRLSVAGHMGVYPATQTMDAAAAVTFDGKLYSARFARACKTDRDNRQVGPLAAAIVEHFRSWRFVLEPAAGQPISFDLELQSEFQPMEVSAPVFHRQRGQHVIWDMWHYAQTGRARGTVRVDGATLEVSPDASFGVRDRSWGVRPIFGQVPWLAPLPESIGKSSVWLAAELPDRAIWCWRIEPLAADRAHLVGNLADQTGRTRVDGAIAGRHGAGPPQRVIDLRPEVAFDRKGRLQAIAARMFDTDESIYDVRLRPITTMYGQALGYGHPEFRHNEWKGDSVAQHEVVDLGDDVAVAGLMANPARHINPFGVEHLCEVTVDGTAGHGVVRLSI